MRHTQATAFTQHGALRAWLAAAVLLLAGQGLATAEWQAHDGTYQVVTTNGSYGAGPYGASALCSNNQETGSVHTTQSRDYEWVGGGEPVNTDHSISLASSISGTGLYYSGAASTNAYATTAYANRPLGPASDSWSVTVNLGPAGVVTLNGDCSADATAGTDSTAQADCDITL